MARSIFFSHFLRGIRHNDKFWQQWAIQFFKFCLIRFLITENPYFQNLFNQHRTVTVCVETWVYMRCIIAAEVLVLTNTYRLLFYGKSVSNITQSLDCAAFFKWCCIIHPIYICSEWFTFCILVMASLATSVFLVHVPVLKATKELG